MRPFSLDNAMPQDSMTRSDLVEELAARFGQLTHKDAEFAVKTILDAVGEALVKGHRIEIRGFGSFSVNHRPPRMGRNPRSGEAVAIPEKRVPHFKPGKALREAVDPAHPAPRRATLSSPKNLFKDQRCENHTRYGQSGKARQIRHSVPMPLHGTARKQHQNS